MEYQLQQKNLNPFNNTLYLEESTLREFLNSDDYYTDPEDIDLGGSPSMSKRQPAIVAIGMPS